MDPEFKFTVRVKRIGLPDTQWRTLASFIDREDAAFFRDCYREKLDDHLDDIRVFPLKD